jgi:hypothetical protein
MFANRATSLPQRRTSWAYCITHVMPMRPATTSRTASKLYAPTEGVGRPVFLGDPVTNLRGRVEPPGRHCLGDLRLGRGRQGGGGPTPPSDGRAPPGYIAGPKRPIAAPSGSGRRAPPRPRRGPFRTAAATAREAATGACPRVVRDRLISTPPRCPHSATPPRKVARASSPNLDSDRTFYDPIRAGWY